ncbi:MAG: pyruvate kinase [Desulforhopalus sp.]|jgi:pyruvate kinase|nr:pyruvate kinase [Desulforhopalus sp.]
MNKTKIIATLGPASQNEAQIIALIQAGMNVARINLSHGNRKSHSRSIELVKKARVATGRFTAILLDTRGPEIRVTDLPARIELLAGNPLLIVPANAPSTPGSISVNYPGLAADLTPGRRILLDDGKLALLVEKIEAGIVHTRILVNGWLGSKKRVSLPDCHVNLPSLTDEDRDDIAFGVQQEVDFIAASFVRRGEDVLAVQRIIEDNGGALAVIAKIENRQGVDNLEEILRVADGLMVARGDLGVEMPAEEVPVIQKRIIRAANQAGKPVITATQMLESMINSPTPTRAEASDVTNAIYDGTDGVMLSAETAVGSYPVEAIRFLARCAEISEASLDYEAILAAGLRNRRPTATDSISYASCSIAADLGAAAIVTATSSGSTARMVARYRPKTPIIAVSPNQASLRKLQLIRGVTTLQADFAATMDEQIDRSTMVAQTAGLIGNGDLIVITAGMPIGTSGTTNMLKVRTVADVCFIGQGAGGGSAIGQIRIVRQTADWLALPEKTIVVLADTDDTMFPFLAGVQGIIIEKPGSSSHAARLVEQLKIPVVCDLQDATRLLENGQTVSIDGANGHIVYGTNTLQ